MAIRRMFNKNITNSARFMKMPKTTQLLYFHLALNADDDGIVEAYNIMRLVGASDDDLKILIAKQFVKILNEDLVALILDWNSHNLIRPDRKTESLYKSLLINEVEKMPGKCQANAGQMPAQVSIGEVSIGEVSIGKKTSCSSEDERDKGFDIFWSIYPRRQAKAAALKKWRTKGCSKIIDDIVDDIKYRLKNQQPNGWISKETGCLCSGEFIPLPVTYINQERWNDEECLGGAK